MVERLEDLIKGFVERMGERKYVFVGAIGVMAHGIPELTSDLDIITKTPNDFEAANLSLQGLGFEETKPSRGFAPNFARWKRRELGADVMLKELWFRAEVQGEEVKQKVTPDEEFWNDVEFKGREAFGVKVPVPKPLDLAVFKVVSSVSPVRHPQKAPRDRDHALKLIQRFSLSSDQLKERAEAMECLPEVEEFIEKTLRDGGKS